MLYDKIRALAKEQKITTRELEKRAGIGDNTMWRWNNHSPAADKLAAVAAVLDVSIDDLMKD
ncbi:MAG: helix-turn-helix transcriptional regulator [Christensenellaceae bacterium]|nr:helix-turn-helix transcriptional regulator [Christensenellaceae bacterium]